jgi:integrase
MYFDHANNYWVAAVSLGYKAGKRVRRKVTGRTKTEVKAKLRDLRRDLDKGVRPSATYTVGNALDDWLAGGLNGRSDRTRELYGDTVKPLRERLGEVKLRELTAGDVQETLDALAGRLSTRSLQITRLCLEWAIRHAEVRDLVGRNVAALVKAPAGRAGRPSKSLTLEQAQELLRAAGGSRLYGYVLLSVTTGLRTEEFRALRWNEVDLDAGTVAVYRAVRATADTKTPKSRRVLSLPQLAVRALREHLKCQAGDGCWLAFCGKITGWSSRRPLARPLIVTTCSASSGRSPRQRVWVPTGSRGRCAIRSCPCSAPTGQRSRTSPTWSGTGARPRPRRSTGR